jgi:hypothetical protein
LQEFEDSLLESQATPIEEIAPEEDLGMKESAVNSTVKKVIPYAEIIGYLTWHIVLQKYSYDKVHENLLKLVADSPHPPKISDLVLNTSYGRIIPSGFVLDLTAGEKDW